MIKFVLSFLCALIASSAAYPQATVVSTCGTAPPAGGYAIGSVLPPTMDKNGNTCTSGGGGGVASTVNQGTAGASSWLVSVSNTPAVTISGTPTVTVSGTVATAPTAGTTGGSGNFYLQPTASDNHQTIKNGAGTVYGVQTTNNSTTTNYIRLYDSGTGFNGCNSATGLKWGMEIPAPASASGVGGGFSVQFPVGIAFSTGISICVSSGYGSTDTTNATATAMMVDVNFN